MSGSYRRSAVYAPLSHKSFKRASNRSLRRHCRSKLACCIDFDKLVLPIPRELSQIYDSPKDGCFSFFGNEAEYKKFLRK